jgi:hypothetical protein
MLIAVSTLDISWVARLITFFGDMVLGSTYMGSVEAAIEEPCHIQLRQVLFSGVQVSRSSWHSTMV